jgi:hypothetical protein
LRRLLLVIFAVFLMSSLTLAQSLHRLEIFGGYSYMHRDMSMVAPSGVHGWNASANWRLYRWIGVTADFSMFYPGIPCCISSNSAVGAKTNTFLFGPQVSLRRRRFSPFAHFLMGTTHLTPGNTGALSIILFTSNDSFTLGAGGGADYSLSKHFALRGQADWLHSGFVLLTSLQPGRHYPPNDNVARISTGLVVRF